MNQNGGCIREESLHSNKRFLMCIRRLSFGEFLMLRPEVTLLQRLHCTKYDKCNTSSNTKLFIYTKTNIAVHDNMV